MMTTPSDDVLSIQLRLKVTTSPLAIYFSNDIIRNGSPTLMGQDKQVFNEHLQNNVIETGRFK